MIKFLRLSVLFLIACTGITSTCYAQFPYIESFRNANSPGMSFGGTPSAFLTAAGSGYANGQHTGTPIDPVGGGYLRLTSSANYQKGYAISDATFPSANGLSVEFEYYIYGGNGADGISFFLFDATANPFVIGSFGGSLGYAQTTNPTLTPGVSKGYLAVGLDEYGNFSNAIEGRQGGTTPIGELRPGSVTLRGKGDGDALTPDNYKFLTTAQQTVSFPFPLVGNGAMRTPAPTDEGYRKVLMLMEPSPLGGYNITVKLTKGGSPGLTVTVIDKYHYTEAAPAMLKYGFASSTGFQTNYHEVRNVTIDVLNPIIKTPPTAVNDVASACQFNQSVVNVVGNDVPSAAGGAIDKTTIDLDPNTAGIQNSLNIPNVGVFATTADGLVQFTPVNAFVGTASCSYNIQDISGTVSNNATITINYSAAPAQPFAGPDQLINVITTPAQAILQATNPVTNTGKWSQISGPNTAAFVNESTYNTTATNLTGGTYVFRWTVKSPGGCELSDDVQVIINRSPVAVDDKISTNLNTDIPIYILDNDTDADGNTTIMRNSITILSAPQNGTLVIDNVTGIVIYKPKNGFTGLDSFVYQIKDIFGAESTLATVVISVNIKPVGYPDNSTTNAQTPVTIRVQDNDNVSPGSTVIKNTEPAHGTVSLNPDGTFTYTPNPDFSGQDTFTYKLVNKDGLQSDPITVTVNVKPAGSDDSVTTPTNTPVIIMAKDNDISKNGTTVVVTANPFNGTIIINPAGNPVYTPANDFSGSDTFKYILRTADGLESNPITVTVKVKPVGSPDNVTTPYNTAITIPVKTNDISKTGTTVLLGTAPTHGTASIDAQGNMVYTPNNGFSGPDTYTYILRTADGIESDPITVNVTVKPLIVIPAPNINIDAISGDPKIIDVPIPPGGTVIITTPPKHGTVTFDPATGKPIYTPNPGYTGPDDFVYIVKDADGNQSNPGTVTITVNPAPNPARIGLAKAMTRSTKNVDGSYEIAYTFTLVNAGDIDINRLSLSDDLAATFPGATVRIKKLVALGSLIINSDYNGTSDKEILSNASVLKATSKELIELEITVILGDKGGVFRNTAFVTGFSVKTGLITDDQSTDGFNPDSQTSGDFSPNAPTPVTLTKDGIFIPGGFSPNNDGINDLFVIENALGKQIGLEVYNRWGNRIYKAKTYQNNWNGKTTEGIHVGEDVPAGTYYYILTIDNKDKRVGYITINR
jgi:gliding motility-associated-like protein